MYLNVISYAIAYKHTSVILTCMKYLSMARITEEFKVKDVTLAYKLKCTILLYILMLQIILLTDKVLLANTPLVAIVEF